MSLDRPTTIRTYSILLIILLQNTRNSIKIKQKCQICITKYGKTSKKLINILFICYWTTIFPLSPENSLYLLIIILFTIQRRKVKSGLELNHNFQIPLPTPNSDHFQLFISPFHWLNIPSILLSKHCFHQLHRFS